jgi:protease-4
MKYVGHALSTQVKLFFSTLTILSAITLFGLVTMLFIAIVVEVSQSIQTITPPAARIQQRIYGSPESPNHILSLPIKGIIVGDESDMGGVGSLFSEGVVTYGYHIKRQLADAAQNKDIKAVVLDINSPGGTIYGAHAVAAAVEQYRQKTGNPVYAFTSGVAASGAYWSAVSADRVFADFGSTTGSIGVISGPYQFYDEVTATTGTLLQSGIVTQNGIDEFYISAGRSKDLGNPFRKMSEEELAHEQTGVNNEYDAFVTYVSKRRGISASVVKNEIGALMFENKRALALGLIDEEADRDTVYEMLAARAKLKSYQVVEESAPGSFLSDLLFTKRPTEPATCAQLLSGKSLMAVSTSHINACH